MFWNNQSDQNDRFLDPLGSFFWFWSYDSTFFWGFKKTTVLPLSFNGQFIGGAVEITPMSGGHVHTKHPFQDPEGSAPNRPKMVEVEANIRNSASARLATKKIRHRRDCPGNSPWRVAKGFVTKTFPPGSPAGESKDWMGLWDFFHVKDSLITTKWAKFWVFGVTPSWSYNHCCDKKKGNVNDVSKKQISKCSSTTLMQTETFLTVILPKLRRVFFPSHTRGILRVLESLWDEDPPEVFRVELLEG